MYFYTLKILGTLHKAVTCFKACFIFLLIGIFSFLHANSAHTKFQAIIFDCDGVLVDTEYLKFLAWKEAFEAQSIRATGRIMNQVLNSEEV